MPTAKEVDNRPMAVGKWPRNHHHHHHSGLDRYHRNRQKCSVDENCIHNYGNLCLDVLLRPELLNEIYGDRSILGSSSNPLLEFCLDGGYLKNVENGDKEQMSPLLDLCSEFSNSSWQRSSSSNNKITKTLQHICQTGCDINVQSSQGYTALHFIINGCNKETFEDVFEAATVLLHHGLDVTLEDNDGNTCLTYLGVLLERQLFAEGLELAKLFLNDSRCNSNHLNRSARSLLSYSAAQGDACSDLTRLLLNHGAQVWPFRAPTGCDASDVIRERDASAFTAFFRAAMSGQGLSNSQVTLRLLCDAMGAEPEFMRTHVLGTMLHLGQLSSGATSPWMVALYVQIKAFMAPYWQQPSSLRYLCTNRIRAALGPKNIISGAEALNLPTSLLSYIHLN